MREITWAVDEAARKAGITCDRLTGGVVDHDPRAGKIVRFRELVRVGGKDMRVCLRVEPRPALAALVAEIEHEQEEERARQREIEARTVMIYLSSRGWGDYSSCEWVGDITRPDDEILAECKHNLTTEHDVDQPSQSDDEIMVKIDKARADWEAAPARKAAREAEEAEDIRRKVANGYCFACETYCHGDCGHYSSDPQVMYRRQMREAAREANYGIND